MNADLINVTYEVLERLYLGGVIEENDLTRTLREWGVSAEVALQILRELKEERKQKEKDK